MRKAASIKMRLIANPYELIEEQEDTPYTPLGNAELENLECKLCHRVFGYEVRRRGLCRVSFSQ